MPLNSVQTNVGAMIALRGVVSAGGELATVERRIATGLRVASARDNGSVWAIAQKERGDIRGLNAVTISLRRGQAITEVALAGGQLVMELLGQMRTRALAGADEGLSDSARAALNQDFQSLRDQLSAAVSGAAFDGVNLIGRDARAVSVLAGLPVLETTTTTKAPKANTSGPQTTQTSGGKKNGTTAAADTTTIGNTKPPKTVTTTTMEPGRITLAASSLALGGPNVSVAADAAFATASEAAVLTGQIEDSLRAAALALSSLGSTAASVDQQLVFVSRLQDAFEAGVGNLADADLGRESARLEAVRLKRDLAVEALGIANRAPTTLLGLFRN